MKAKIQYHADLNQVVQEVKKLLPTSADWTYELNVMSTFLNKNMITSRSLLGWQIPIRTDKSYGKARILNISSTYIKNLFKYENEK